jgi:endonuclease III
MVARHQPSPRKVTSPRPNATAGKMQKILEILEREHPDARCALDWHDPFHLAVATILSAQCTDVRVNTVTPALFARFPDAQTLARAALPEVEEIIRSTGFFRAKAKSVVGFAKGIAARPAKEFPRTIDALVKLPGIGRKTANVVLGHAFGINEGIAVDTHVLRVSNRLGLVRSDDPLEVERRLMDLVPKEQWTRVTDLVIFHGRRVCDARKPACGRCVLFAHCTFEDRIAWATVAPEPKVAKSRTTVAPASGRAPKKPR